MRMILNIIFVVGIISWLISSSVIATIWRLNKIIVFPNVCSIAASLLRKYNNSKNMICLLYKALTYLILCKDYRASTICVLIESPWSLKGLLIYIHIQQTTSDYSKSLIWVWPSKLYVYMLQISPNQK